MVLANPGILDDPTIVDEPLFLQSAWRGTTVFATPARQGESTRPGTAAIASAEAAYRTGLLDYAAFVLDQEAKYCQQ
jgi:hypothetical protein